LIRRLLPFVVLPLFACGGGNASVPPTLSIPAAPPHSPENAHAHTPAPAPAPTPAPEPEHHAHHTDRTRLPTLAEGFAKSADGVELHYVTDGDGDAAVVFSHCWGCNLHEWEPAMHALRPKHRVVALDLAGHGLSGKKRAKWTVEAYAKDIKAVVDKLGLKKIILVGHSMSGAITLQAAIDMPDKVVGLVPIDTLHDADRKMDAEKRKKFFDAFRKDFKGTTDRLVRSLFPKDADQDLVASMVAEELKIGAEIGVPTLENVFAFDEGEALKKIKVPIRAIEADLYPTNLDANHKYAPQFEAKVIKGVGHWPMYEKPMEFAHAVAETIDTFDLK
jgi:pimeloyl-ACP methyl ester carboxylesterase